MGTAIVDAPQQSAEMAAAKPARERQFQVVPMPGVFTRGRWKCWDYRERDETQNEKKEQILEFEKEKGDAIVVEAVPVPTVTSSENAIDIVSNYSISTSEISAAESTPVKEKESSSTIVVTSIAPAPPTPQHGTPQNQTDDIDRSGHGMQTSFSSQLSHSQADLSVASSTQAVSGNITAGSTEPHMQQHASVATMVSSSSGQPPQQQLNIVPPPQSAPQSCRPPVTPNNEPQPSEDESSSGANAAAVTPNVAAIDNKIEQAMDLVKTHLTFAVREEVEILRQTIADLEHKVSILESENQLLRQYAPGEVVSNLPALAQQQKAAHAPAQSAALPPVLPPPKVPVGFCSSTFATTLNNVVADVRNELSSVSAFSQQMPPQQQ